VREVGDLDGSSSRHAMTPISVLVADDDPAARARLVECLRRTGGDVVEARDGAEAVRLGLQLRPYVALFDLDVPPRGGLDAALTLRELYARLRIALQASDTRALEDRAPDRDLPVFDKVDVECIVTWTRMHVAAFTAELRDPLPTLELRCALCGYGISSRVRPDRCPMCYATASRVRARQRRAIEVL
jgi:CheY-like chemotaxis protein